MKEKRNIILAGLVVGIAAVVLTYFGNPANMGFCIACFIRDIAGAVGMQRAEIVQYVRPEIIGLVGGAFLMALISKEFKSKGGSSPVLRFILGFCVMVGALVFLGCPLRMVIRLGGGDLNALVGLAGFVVGILAGVFFLNQGFSLKRNYTMPKLEGFALTGVNVALLVLLMAFPSVLIFSQSGPGSMHAPILMSLAAGLIVGALAQKTRLCMVGGIRDVVLFKDWTLLAGFVAIFAAVLVGNLILGKFHLGFVIDAQTAQPVAHTDGLWNFMGMVVVGLGSVLLGGCPLRQLILAGEGNSDSAVAVLGMFVGAAFSHNLGMASSASGVGANGKVGAIGALIVVLLIAVFNTRKVSEKAAQTSAPKVESAQ